MDYTQRLKQIVTFFMLMALMVLCPGLALAQNITCTDTGSDAFIASQRARRALQDYDYVNRAFQKDFDLMASSSASHGIVDTPRFRFFAGPMADVRLFPLLKSCTTAGTRSSSLVQTRLGIMAGVDELKWGFSLRYVYSLYSNTLDGFPPAQDEPDNPDEMPDQGTSTTPDKFEANTGQSTHALRLQLTQWFAFTLGQINYAPVTLKAAEDGTRLLNVEETKASKPHDFLRLEVPIADLSFDFIFGDDRENIETLYVDLNQLPLFVVPFALSLKAAYLRNENQYYGVLGVDFINEIPQNKRLYTLVDPSTGVKKNGINIKDYNHTVGLDVATEFNDVNLRFLRLRTALKYHVYDRDLDKLANTIMGQPYFAFELDWQASVFNSRYLQTQTGQSWALGTTGTLSVGAGLRLMSIYFASSLGFNRPETLTQMAQAVNAPETTIELRWRIGF